MVNLQRKKELYRLEFSPDQQHFHLESLNKPNPKEENTNGWVTIGEGIDSKLNYIYKKISNENLY